MKNEVPWNKIPLSRAMLEIIASKPEGLPESKLESMLKKEYGIETSKPELHGALMKLELGGLIYVESVGKELLIKPAPILYQNNLKS
ncbi:MAG: ArsR family transcriptional regulator [Desulfurococcaceae archaeon]